MAGFDMDYSKANDFNVADGVYEVVINSAKQDVFQQSGNDYIQFDLIIRNDIADQKSKGSHIFYRIFPNKETKKYSIGMLLAVGKAAGIPDKTHFDNLDDYFNKLYHLPLLVTVKNEKWESKGKSGENLNVKKLEATKFPKVAHKFKTDEIDKAESNAQAGMNGDSIDISDASLPF
ncbi:DUF669 domain-containing protein [Paucilactobacillus suebicus]|uniref:DUF669 domain-containing protein n=1 Tax=Paucilactobacillus suebicus DSM 5007 = KCTC 3549 TaxID=1423807 RepID=A0A0R1VXU9_9LACO|nr:DUF669 domain-containing protein [Paucilactobacillus suebicus]KRM10191.1 hypothetical protein FD16_GL001461 [Paucilactobacillus suebicus DSM 5007 = KCTC 3549]